MLTSNLGLINLFLFKFNVTHLSENGIKIVTGETKNRHLTYSIIT